MVQAVCGYVAGIYPFRKKMLGTFDSVRWNARVSRPEGEVGGGGGNVMLSPREMSR